MLGDVCPSRVRGVHILVVEELSFNIALEIIQMASYLFSILGLSAPRHHKQTTGKLIQSAF